MMERPAFEVNRYEDECDQKSAEGPFLTAVFRSFNNCQIQYCVLRNYETLPNTLNGSDIDILFSKECFLEAHDIISQTASKFSGKCIVELKAHRVLTRGFCGFYQGKWWGVRFDTFTYAGTNGCDILPTEHILQRSFFHNGLRVACPSDAVVLSFLKDIVGGGNDPKGYGREASSAYAREHDLYSSILKKLFGKKIFREQVLLLLEGKGRDFSAAKKDLRCGWKITFLRKKPLVLLRRGIEEWMLRLHRIYKPPGFSVALVGSDGSGKGTIINGVTPPLERALHTQIAYEHMRPNLFPSLAQLFGRPEPEGPVTDPHCTKPSGTLGSTLRITYYSLDFIFGYWLKVFPRVVKRPTIWVFDRYFYDYLIDPRRSRMSLPKWIINLYSVFIPRPDLILCLGTDPETIHSRKSEISFEEIKRQVLLLKEFCKKVKSAVWIDTGCPIEESINNTLDVITGQMARRYA